MPDLNHLARALAAGLLLLPACADTGGRDAAAFDTATLDPAASDTAALDPAPSAPSGEDGPPNALGEALARYHGQVLSLPALLRGEWPVHCVEAEEGVFECGDEAPAPPPGGEYCTLYQHSWYGGASATFVTGTDYNALSAISWNDRASSLRCGNGGQIQLFEHSNYAGSYTAWTGGEVSYLGVFNDKASSVKFSW